MWEHARHLFSIVSRKEISNCRLPRSLRCAALRCVSRAGESRDNRSLRAVHIRQRESGELNIEHNEAMRNLVSSVAVADDDQRQHHLCDRP